MLNISMKIWSISSVNVAALKNLIPVAACQYFAVQFRVLVGLDVVYNFWFTVLFAA